MSSTSIPDQVKVKLWVAAGGRCQYPGCNIALYRDDVTLAEMNRSYIAHIIADAPGGPRGDKELSLRLAKEFSNLMLLCDTHHRLIDRDDVAGHPVELLQEFKRDHEERIEHVTGLDSKRKTYVITYAANIGRRKGQIAPEQVRAAVLAEGMYPATVASIDLDMTQNATTDDGAAFWETECRNIDGFIATRVSGRGPDGNEMKHLSIFALAPIPLLMYFGKKLGDILPMEIYQRHRDIEEWVWPSAGGNSQPYSVDVVRSAGKGASDVILELSLSDLIDPDSIRRVLDGELPWYRLSIPEPNRDHLKSKAQLREFSNLYHRTLSRITADAGKRCMIHLFHAVPVSAAIQMGRNLLPKADARIQVYDFNRDENGWLKAICM
jgi:hypothetical protein